MRSPALYLLILSGALMAECCQTATAAVFTVSTTSDSGTGSFRNALIAANAAGPGVHTINCPLNGTITFLSALPTIDVPLTINGPSSAILEFTKTGTGGSLLQSSAATKPPITINDITFCNLYITYAIYNRGGLTLNRCIFRNNLNSLLIFSDHNVSISNCMFHSNTDCVGIFYSSMAYFTSLVNIISNCSFFNNFSVSTSLSNCINNFGATLTLINCTFSNNSAGAGAAIFMTGLSNGKSKAINCTFYGNVANNGSGGAIFVNALRSIRLENCIVTGNTATVSGMDMMGIDSSDYGHNIIGNTAGITFRGSVAGNITGVASTSVLNATLAFNGGLTPTQALIAGSPAIDAASTVLAPPADQRNFARVNGPDIGAYEYGANTPLPVQLLSFDGTLHANGIVLNWKTATEIHAAAFYLEKHSEEGAWQPLSTVVAHGDASEINTYDYLDEDISPGMNYYRLLQQDADGTEHLLKTVAVQASANRSFSVRPTLVTDHRFYISGGNKIHEPVEVSVFDYSGNLICRRFFEITPGSSAEFDTGSELSNGVYLVRVKNEFEESCNRIVICTD